MKDKIFVGMMRPEWEKFIESCGIVYCSCHIYISQVKEIREHWQLGHFDYPVYKEIENVEISGQRKISMVFTDKPREVSSSDFQIAQETLPRDILVTLKNGNYHNMKYLSCEVSDYFVKHTYVSVDNEALKIAILFARKKQ